MRTYRLLMPAVTLAGALALAGCGGGSGNPVETKKCKDANGNDFTVQGNSCPDTMGPMNEDPPLTGDELAEAKAIKDGLIAYGTTSLTSTRINTTSGKLGTPNDDDPKWSDYAAPVIGNGWTAKGYERETDDGAMERIISYTSGEPFMDQPLADWVADTDRTTITLTGTSDPKEAKSLTIAASSYEADLFPSGFVAAKDADSDKDGTQIEGMFAGIQGTFSCGNTTCARSTDQDGMITLTQEWTFEPDGRIHRLDVPAKYSKTGNPKFMTFGYWWSREEGRDDKITYMVDAFADGEVKGIGLPGNAAEIVSASYSGKASGGYVREVLDGGKKVPAEEGLFTADVTLSAVFADQTNTVQGSIHNFMSGSTPISDWKLALKGTTANDSNGQFDGMAGESGTYRGQFFGGEAPAGTASGEAGKAPVGVAGVFTSGDTFANGHAAGAFGAGLDE